MDVLIERDKSTVRYSAGRVRWRERGCLCGAGKCNCMDGFDGCRESGGGCASRMAAACFVDEGNRAN